MKFRYLSLLLVLVSPANAKDITITLNDDEQRVFVQLLDAAVKATGLQGAEAGAHFARKIAQAQATPIEPEKQK